jgi:hypothetical protein
VAPSGLTYATVTKRREKGRVVEVGTRIAFGTIAAVLLALGRSKASRAINTAFIERQNGTDRHRNARKARKTYRFSKQGFIGFRAVSAKATFPRSARCAR